MSRLGRLASAGLIAALLTSACDAGAAPTEPALPGENATSQTGATGPQLAASFYPLQYVTQRIAGPDVTVLNLTPPGAEPHDLELSAQDVTVVANSPLVVYLAGFQPAVDAATRNTTHAFDVASQANLVPASAHASQIGPQASQEHADEHTSEEGDSHDEALDPHFWLDPARLRDVSASIEGQLSRANPSKAAQYQANLKSLDADLAALDAQYRVGLAQCAIPDLVTSHEAFGYLAGRYGFRQVGIAGLSPDAEPSPKALAALIDYVRANQVTTIYYETLASPDVARTVAQNANVGAAVLNPLEGVEPGEDYLSVMRTNLSTLRKGQSCT